MFHVEQAGAVKISEHEFAALGSSAPFNVSRGTLRRNLQIRVRSAKHEDVPRETIKSTAKRNEHEHFFVPRATTTQLPLAIPNQEESLQGSGN